MTQGLAILEFALGILEFPTMSSPSLTRGSLYEILEFPASLRGSKATEARNSRFMLGILEFLVEILEFLFKVARNSRI